MNMRKLITGMKTSLICYEPSALSLGYPRSYINIVRIGTLYVDRERWGCFLLCARVIFSAKIYGPYKISLEFGSDEIGKDLNILWIDWLLLKEYACKNIFKWYAIYFIVDRNVNILKRKLLFECRIPFEMSRFYGFPNHNFEIRNKTAGYENFPARILIKFICIALIQMYNIFSIFERNTFSELAKKYYIFFISM